MLLNFGEKVTPHMKKLCSLILFTLSIFTGFANDPLNLSQTLKWSDEVKVFSISGKYKIKSYGFEGAAHKTENQMLPEFYKHIRIKKPGPAKVRFKATTFAPLANQELYRDNPLIGTAITINTSVAFEKKQPSLILSFIPIRKNPRTGIFEKLTAFSLSVDMLPDPGLASARNNRSKFADNSVLASGNWYKISVSRTGIFKLDHDFLSSMGLNPSSVNPKHIRIYGNGGGMLPEANSVARIDDLQENRIFVSGEGDGQFNQSDYILFYAMGPDQWILDTATQRFEHHVHHYSTVNYYFLTTDLGAGKRIQAQSSSVSAAQTVTSFDDHVFHEQELVNLIQSGREWYGEEFDLTTSQDITFNIPNIDAGSPVHLKTNLVARSTSGASTFTVTAPGKSQSYTLSAVPVSYESLYASSKTGEFTFSTSASQITVNFNFTKPNAGAVGWLNYVALNARRKLIMDNDQMAFRDLNSVGNQDTKFEISGATSTLNVWDVTDPANVKDQQITVNGSKVSFILSTDILREFVAHTGKSYYTPSFVEKVTNQNLHGSALVDMIIITAPEFQAEAEALASIHENEDGLDVLVTTPKTIYNEFSSGVQDIAGIRDFIKMFYDRAGTDTTAMPEYLLLFGSGSYDYKDRVVNNTNYIPVYQSVNSTDPVESYATDDFYGFLDDNEGGNVAQNNLLDIAIGRMPVRDNDEAKAMIKKIVSYRSNASFGNWRNTICFVADDEDSNIHLDSSDNHASFVANNYPVYNIDKIFFDAFQQVATPGGSRYPDAKEAFEKRIFSGSLIVNYTGHGGVNGWAHERVLDVSSINSFDNLDKMPLFVTATCEFSRYDDPEKKAAGVQLLLSEKGGAIAMMTTVRLVYSSSNANINSKFFNTIFEPIDGEMPTMGQVIRNAKNASETGINNRKFTLLGDPALKLAYPKYKVTTSDIKINNESSDTIQALAKVTVTGEVKDNNGNKLSKFNGIVYPTIYDKSVEVQTLKNDPGSKLTSFDLQKNIIYKGKASVKNGAFTFTFIVPKDISYSYGSGKISYYADNTSSDANGYDADFIIGGTADEFAQDNTGPDIQLFLNDDKFVFGGMTDENPVLIVKLSDESGINTVGNGIGHDLTAVLDNETEQTHVLNEFYEAALDNYQQGEVRYPLADIPEGHHHLKVKAWDVYNNSGESYTEFVVVNSAEFELDHVLNYPNPFTTRTSFFFEHNRPGQELKVQLRIYTVSGRVIKTIDTDITTDGFRVDNIEWDGLDDFGDKIGKGVYVYQLSVRAPDGYTASKIEKLVILR